MNYEKPYVYLSVSDLDGQYEIFNIKTKEIKVMDDEGDIESSIRPDFNVFNYLKIFKEERIINFEYRHVINSVLR